MGPNRHEQHQQSSCRRQDGRTIYVEVTKKDEAEFRTKIVSKDGGYESAAAVEVELSACDSVEEGDTVTTAQITTDCSSSWSLLASNSMQSAQASASTGCSVDGPFIPSWSGVENMVDELCSPVYSARKVKSGWARRGQLALSYVGPDENTLFPHSPSTSTGGEEPITTILDGGECATDLVLQGRFQAGEIERCDSQQSDGECSDFPSNCGDDGHDNDCPNDFLAAVDKKDENDSKEDVQPAQNTPQDQQVSLALPTPRPPISRLFGEMLCRVYLNNNAAAAAAATASVAELPGAGLPSLTPVSIQSSFILFPHERSLLIAHNWAQSSLRSSPKTDVYSDRKRTTDGRETESESEPEKQTDQNAVAQCHDISMVTAAYDDDTQMRDDISSVSSSFWEISESGVMTPASRGNLSATIFFDTVNGAVVEEEASMFEDEELRAFMLMTQGGDDAAKIFPTFSDEDSHSQLKDCVSDVYTDDGLSDEIGALNSIEHDLRAELDNADQVIKGVLARQEKIKIARKSSSSSISPLTTTESMQQLSFKQEGGYRICKLPTDDSSLPLSVDTNSILGEPSADPETSVSLRKVRFSQKTQEYIFFSEGSYWKDDEEESFHDFLFGTFEDIHASFGDFLDEIGCKPISFSLTSACVSSRGR